MIYIDLELKQHDKKNDAIYTLSEVISLNDITVVLGAPGSGKTSLLEEYGKNHETAQFLKIKQFIKLDNQVHDNMDILLLDGLDEYRSVTNDKTFVLTELGAKINQLSSIKIVISCREMDWYGDIDEKALKEQVDKEAKVYDILSLSQAKKVELANALEVENSDKFIEKYSDLGFLENPQMFMMIADIYASNLDQDFTTKKELYLSFIKHARESNIEHAQHAQIDIEPTEFLRYVGYIAFFYMFTNIDTLDDKFIDEICDSSKGYPKEKLLLVLKSKLFSDSKFIHRTIAEFSLAHYLINEIILQDNPLSKKRIIALFVNNGRIPTELRGTFAWLCSISEDEELFSIDPYYQAVYGDISYFSDSLKKKVLLAVKEYAVDNPWFFQFGHSVDLEGFYNERLDSFLMEELDEGLKLNNHYKHFVINSIVTTKPLSLSIYQFLKEKMIDPSIASYIKDDMVEAFRDDEEFLLEVLNLIKDKTIEDSGDRLKETILRISYRRYISSAQIVPYLAMYEDKVGGHCYYLFDTPFEEKYALVDEIHKAGFIVKDKDPMLRLFNNVKGFIADYFLEVILSYDEELSAQDIYDIIKHFKQYYKWYDSLEIKSYRYALTDKEKLSDEKLENLANELYALYLDDMLTGDETRFRIYNFRYFFSYKNPTNQTAILLSKMNEKNENEKNKELFLAALAYSPKDEDNKLIITDEIEKAVLEYELEDVLKAYLNPVKSEWEIENEKNDKKREEKKAKNLTDNEAYFSAKSDEEIQTEFKDLHYITNLIYLNNENEKQELLTEATFLRLKSILKDAIYKPLIDEKLLTVDSLVKNAPSARRYIDNVYYVSSVLNDSYSIDDIEFSKYLYLVNLLNANVMNVVKGNLVAEFDENRTDLVLGLLYEAIEKLLTYHYPKMKEIVLSYIRHESEVKRLKKLYLSHNQRNGTLEENFLYGFLHLYHFDIHVDDLEKLNKLKTNDENNDLINALLIFKKDDQGNFTRSMAIALQSVFEYKRKHFLSLESDVKVRLLHYLFSEFNTTESLENESGFQSSRAICASFLNYDAIDLVNEEELEELLKLHYDEDDIWKNKILHKLNELKQVSADSEHSPYSIEKVKNFALSANIISYSDFFEDVLLKLEDIKTIIESNRNQDKNAFYNEDGNAKNEESCRDIIFQRLSDKYGYDWKITREKYEANNRVDLNVKYKSSREFEVQVECKKDNNRQLYTGIKDQLINKYFSKDVEYGIYLIFYFGAKKSKEKMLRDIQNSVEVGYEDKIKIICIDLLL